MIKYNFNQLAETEHRRWMATKYYNGWTYNKNRNKDRKQHNNLIAFNQLDQGTQDYDLKQIMDLEELWRL
jgi:hypothetical protein